MDLGITGWNKTKENFAFIPGKKIVIKQLYSKIISQGKKSRSFMFKKIQNGIGEEVLSRINT